MPQIVEIISWFGLFYISGFCFWLVFHDKLTILWDKGYAISKILGLGSITLILWLLGFVLKVPIDTLTATFAFLLFNGGLLLYFILKKKKFPEVKISLLIVTEIVFIAALCFGLYVASMHPVIDNNTERMMDFMLLNSNTSNSVLPAKDLWFSGSTINYYYFGSFFFSVINKITSTNTYDSYIFALAFVFAIACMQIFALAVSIRKSMFFGFVGVVLTMFFANFDFIYQYILKYLSTFQGQTFRFIAAVLVLILIETIIYLIARYRHRKFSQYLLINLILLAIYFFIIGGFSTITNFVSWIHDPSFQSVWFWDNSRVIPYTINEFPYYSLMVGDLHPHYMDLMFFTCQLSLIFLDFKILSPELIHKVFQNGFKSALKNKSLQTLIFIKSFSLIIFSIGIATNSWELIFIGILIAIKDFVFLFRIFSFKSLDKNIKGWKFWQLVAVPAALDAFFYLGGLILQLPFLLSIQAPVAGLKTNIDFSSQPQFIILWAIPFAFAASGLFYLIRKLWIKKKINETETFILVMFIAGIVLIIFTELFFLADLFYFENPIYKRANTVFKLNYAGFVMFGLASSWTLFRLFKKQKISEIFRVKDILKLTLNGIVSMTLITAVLVIFYYVPESLSQWSGFNQFLSSRYSLDAARATEQNSKDVISAADFLK